MEYEINDIFKYISSNLKAELGCFLYKNAIDSIPFLQNRDQYFYINYLYELVPYNFMKGSLLIREKTKSEEVFFILDGKVLNIETGRIFSKGSIIGETDIIR